MAVNLPTFPEFDLQPKETVATRFEKYIKKINNMFMAMNVTDAAKKRAMLMHYVGHETSDIFEPLTVADAAADVAS